MKNELKRIISLVCVLAMLVSSFPLTAFLRMSSRSFPVFMIGMIIVPLSARAESASDAPCSGFFQERQRRPAGKRSRRWSGL